MTERDRTVIVSRRRPGRGRRLLDARDPARSATRRRSSGLRSQPRRRELASAQAQVVQAAGRARSRSPATTPPSPARRGGSARRQRSLADLPAPERRRRRTGRFPVLKLNPGPLASPVRRLRRRCDGGTTRPRRPARSPRQAATSTLPPGAAVGPAGFPIEPFTFTFQGNFFHLADFFKRLRAVRRGHQQASVGQRPADDPERDQPRRRASRASRRSPPRSSATTYLVPAGQGLMNGATPTGPRRTNHPDRCPRRHSSARRRRRRGDLPGAMSFLNGIITDLREKRLWPVAVVLLVALVAVPVLLSTSSAPAPTPAHAGRDRRGRRPAATAVPAVSAQHQRPGLAPDRQGRAGSVHAAGDARRSTATATATTGDHDEHRRRNVDHARRHGSDRLHRLDDARRHGHDHDDDPDGDDPDDAAQAPGHRPAPDPVLQRRGLDHQRRRAASTRSTRSSA